MKIPLVTRLRPSGRIRKGPHKGKPIYYKTALLNTLIYLRPQVCLEIGTYKGGSSKIFQIYFDKYEPDGALVTADIKRYVTLHDPRVHQVIVYPHSVTILQRHACSIKDESLLKNWRKKLKSSVVANCLILNEKLNLLGTKYFDFIFIDGDHIADSLLKDLKIAEIVTKPPHYALLDDTFESEHESSELYHRRLVFEYEHYEFEDWPIFAGASLIWKGH